MKGRVLIIWPGFDPGIASLFKFILDNFNSRIVFIKKGGKEFSQKKIELGVLEAYAKKERLSFWNYDGFRVTDYNLRSLFKLTMDLYTILKQEPWKFVLLSTNNPVHTKIGFVLCKVMRIRCGVKVEDWLEYDLKNQLIKFYHQMGKFIIRKADYVFPHGQASKEYCLSLGKRADRIKILPLVIPNYDPNEDHYGDKIKKLVYCGRIIEEKNILLLLRAFGIIQKEYPNIKLIIAGNGQLLPEMKAYVKKHGLENKVCFRGAYSRNELADILTNDSALILPSKKEGWGMVVNEATSLCRPVIVSDSAGVALDLVVDGQNGFVFRSNDLAGLVTAIDSLLKSPRERIINMQKYSKMLFNQYNNFSKIRSVIEQVLDY